jgi:cytochrome c oxidase subunit 4
MAYDVHTQEHHADGDHHGHHIIPRDILLKVFGGLIFLTVLTVLTATQMDLGVFDVPLALAIAASKSALVVMFFMALKYDNRVNTLTFVVGGIFVIVFLTFTLFDTLFRGDLSNVDRLTVEERTAQEEALRARDPGEEGLRIAPADFQNQEDAASADAAVDDTTTTPSGDAASN